MRILIIEDELELLSDLSKGLTIKGYAVDQAETGPLGYQMAIDEDYDLIVLDLNLPELSGLEILSKLSVEKPETKILILSANHQLETKLSGFELGASDYLTKPFHFEELEARIRVLINRRFIQQTTILTYRNLSMDTLKRMVTVNCDPRLLSGLSQGEHDCNNPDRFDRQRRDLFCGRICFKAHYLPFT